MIKIKRNKNAEIAETRRNVTRFGFS